MSSGVSPTIPPAREELRRWLRLTQRLTVAALLAAIAIIGFSVYKLNRTMIEKKQAVNQLDTQLKGLDSQIKDRTEKLEQLEKDYSKALALANAPAKKLALFDQIRPKAEAVPDGKGPDGKQYYDFSISLDAPESVRDQIARVTYHLDHPSFENKTLVGNNPGDGFKVGYHGWGALRLVTIDVLLKNGTTHPYYFDMIKALGW